MIPADSPTVEADIDRITQVISNILGNAIKFTSKEEGGIISVSIEKNHSNQEEVIVDIRDTGEGIIMKYYLDYSQSLLRDLSQALD